MVSSLVDWETVRTQASHGIAAIHQLARVRQWSVLTTARRSDQLVLERESRSGCP
jgi:hypothetical protein